MSNSIQRYFKTNKETPTSLARRAKVSASTVTRALRGERDVSLKLARKIETATDGEVSAKSFVSICMKATSVQSMAAK